MKEEGAQIVHQHQTRHHLVIQTTFAICLHGIVVLRLDVKSNDPEDRPVANYNLGCDVPLAAHAHDAEHVGQRQELPDAHQAFRRQIRDVPSFASASRLPDKMLASNTVTGEWRLKLGQSDETEMSPDGERQAKAAAAIELKTMTGGDSSPSTSVHLISVGAGTVFCDELQVTANDKAFDGKPSQLAVIPSCNLSREECRPLLTRRRR